MVSNVYFQDRTFRIFVLILKTRSREINMRPNLARLLVLHAQLEIEKENRLSFFTPGRTKMLILKTK